MSPVYVGVAGWSLPKNVREQFTGEGSHLERYARKLNCVEINSAFHREHQPKTYERWAASVPDDFRFSVKLSKYFTHEKRLEECGPKLKETLEGISALGPKWRVLLVQLPPKLEFEARLVGRFLGDLKKFAPQVKLALEPRHPSWVGEPALCLLADHGAAKVLADPERCHAPKALRPTVESRLRYFRLHGSPVMYRSPYPRSVLARLVWKIREPLSPAEETWCVFDNTALDHGTADALTLRELLARPA